ncbi:hypothetical protein WJX75_005922 [Coccomyxa subellipsoidea]|uniref:Carbohydrate kinase PfkB domain-containing protein n=1 Tax=Coccomyxa subellipsoidea TaxID=248742 RepID=A0ABR2YRY4_9CHLO
MVMDVQAKPSTGADVCRGGSVPGKVQQTPGGVARNICECLALLCNSDILPASARERLRPLLVSVLGHDHAGDMLLAHMHSLGLPTHAIHRVPGASTPSVSIIFDNSGELAASVADVAALEEHLPAVLRQHTADIQSAPLVILDGNLSPEALLEAAQMASEGGVPIWYEPVSAAKAVRATSALHMMHYISPNAKELISLAEALSSGPGRPRPTPSEAHKSQTHPSVSLRSSAGQSSSDGSAEAFADGSYRPFLNQGADAVGKARNAIEQLRLHLCTVLHAGVKCVVLTLGHMGAALCTLSGDRRWLEIEQMAALPAEVVNTSGAGDCLVAGTLFGILRGCSPVEALAHGMAVAHQAVQCSGSVPKNIDAGQAQHRARAVLRSSQRYRLPVL